MAVKNRKQQYKSRMKESEEQLALEVQKNIDGKTHISELKDTLMNNES